MSDAAYDARLADANAYIDTFITERRKGAEALLDFAEQAKKEAAAKALAELSMGPPRPETPNTTIVQTDGMNTLGQIGLARFGPGGGRRKSKRRKSKRTSKSKKSRR